MDLKYLKKIGIYIVSAIISLLLIAYILYHFIGSFSKEVEYTPAVVFTQNETVALDIYIMRSEQVLYSASPGEVSRIYEDGTKVAVNTVVANIYGGGTSSISSSIMALDNAPAPGALECRACVDVLIQHGRRWKISPPKAVWIPDLDTVVSLASCGFIKFCFPSGNLFIF